MNISAISKALGAGLGGAVGGGVVGIPAAVAALPPGTPWYGYVIVVLGCMAITAASSAAVAYKVPANRPAA